MERAAAGDVLYYVLLLGSLLFVLWFLPKAIDAWKGYLKKRFQSEIDRVLLEIRIPREIQKTPLAMEYVLNALNEPSGGDWWTNITTGKTWPFYSLEMVSDGGEVHFYIWCQKNYKARVEAHFYAHYPEIELVEVPDYTKQYPFTLETHKLFGFEYALGKADPIPIATYKIAGLDKGGREPEEQIDPISQTIEAMSNIGPDHQMWVQIVFRSHKPFMKKTAGWKDRVVAFFKMLIPGETKEMVKNFWLFWNGKTEVNWLKESGEIIEKTRSKYNKDESGISEMSKSDKMLIEAISENTTKQGFDVGIRTLYMSTRESFDGDSNIHMMGSLFKQYAAGDVYNFLKPKLITSTSYPWQDRSGKEMKKIKGDLIKNYRRRKFLLADVHHYKYGKESLHTFVLSSEELATIFHLPGQVTQTPSFERIESTTGQAPANLPI